jgi:hypothetical protein
VEHIRAPFERGLFTAEKCGSLGEHAEAQRVVRPVAAFGILVRAAVARVELGAVEEVQRHAARQPALT